MLPNAITLRNYRSFVGPQRLELRPLTLLYGPNNAGKSALLRCLPLVADSLSSKGLDALCFENRFRDLEIDFESLCWKGRAETDESTIGIRLHFDNEQAPSSIEWAIREESTWKRIIVQGLLLYDASDQPLLTAEWKVSRGDRRSNVLTYRIERPGQSARVATIEWSGLVPQLDSIIPPPVASNITRRLNAFASSVLWLRSLRPAPNRFTRWSGGVRWSLEPDGSDAAIILAGEPEVRDEVARWYREHAKAELLLEETRPREVRVTISRTTERPYSVDLIDSGEGLTQILPVLTAMAMARRHCERAGPSIVAIEEPEAHLHPDLQTKLIRQAGDVIAASHPCILFETHSLPFLQAVQVEVARKDRVIHPEDVMIYWVRQLPDGRSVADPIELDDLARFKGNWPPDAFQEDLKLSAQLQEVREEREPI